MDGRGLIEFPRVRCSHPSSNCTASYTVRGGLSLAGNEGCVRSVTRCTYRPLAARTAHDSSGSSIVLSEGGGTHNKLCIMGRGARASMRFFFYLAVPESRILAIAPFCRPYCRRCAAQSVCYCCLVLVVSLCCLLRVVSGLARSGGFMFFESLFVLGFPVLSVCGSPAVGVCVERFFFTVFFPCRRSPDPCPPSLVIWSDLRCVLFAGA